MTRQRKSWLQRLMKWLFRQLHWIANKSGSIFQTINGNRNQTIGVMRGNSIAIANVERLIQNFHLPHQEILSLESFWENWSQETEPPLSPNLVIGGREQERDRVLSWLHGSPRSLTLQGDSPAEAIAFLAAVVQGLGDEQRIAVLSRAIVVDGATSWQELVTSSAEPLILIARLSQPEGIGRAIKSGHHVFIPSGRTGAKNAVFLPRIVRDAAEKSLKEMGWSDDQTRNLATLARRSLSALRRKLAIAPSVQHPTWAQPNHARELLAPMLASVWDGSSQGDREALAQLSNMPYENLQSILVRWANESDSPIRRVGDIWMIAAQEDAWRLLARYLTKDDLQRFENVVINILSELEPAFELPPDQRFAASVYGKVLTRSGHLRNGVAEMLALIATLSSEIQFSANRTDEEVACRIVRQLMEKSKNNETLWASLAYQLPLLAEAAPGTFLGAVDEDLTGGNPILVSLFQDQTSDGTLMGSSPHTGLLWALETLAWNPNYLSSAALSLARLARLDPGGRLVNRPAHSLRNIFICWHPNTTASLESRLKVLDTIRKREPDVAWYLLMSLLPKHHSTVFPTHRTKWRDWVPDSPTLITEQEYIKATTAILEWLISDAGTNITRWCSLIVAASSMTMEQREVLLQHLERFDPKQFSSNERVQICDCLRKETVSHRDFPDAKWAIPTEHVQRLEEIYARFEPEPLINHYCWLFKHGVKLPGMRGSSWEEREKVVENLRTEALQEILEAQGWEEVLKLSEKVKEPALVGQILAKAQLLPIDLGLFLKENLGVPEAWRSQMVQTFIKVNAYKHGEQWIEDCLNANLRTWRPEQYGEFLLCLPFNVSLLNRLDAVDEEVQRYFWSRRQDVSLLEAAQAERVLTQLLKFERPCFAVDIIGGTVDQAPGILLPQRIVEVLEISVRAPLEQNFDFSAFAYHSAELLNYLEKTDISRDRLASLEFLYLQIHKHYRRPRILYEELSKDPELFIEALQCIFRAENEPSAEVSDKAKVFAELALKLLESWKQMPGVQEDGLVDAQALRAWVIRAREVAAKCGRSKVADIYIGYLLAFSPADSDEVWPHIVVRDLIEELANPVIERGWRIQTFKNRGITTRLPTDGGEQERTLVRQYEDYARQLTDRWPRTAAVLREMADRYSCQATEQDQQAELTQDFWR